MSISSFDFSIACHNLHRTWLDVKQDTEWNEVKVLQTHGITYLRITKHIQHEPRSSQDDYYNNEETEHHEEDDEALRTPLNNQQKIQINYDIIHSPTYQVPVLYISIATTESTSTQTHPQSSPNDIYNLLVPQTHKDQLQHIGPMGAVSMTDHPVTGLPVYFIHPCRTSEAMASISGVRGEMDSTSYLLAWLGLVGGSVGLNIPVELAEAMFNAGSRQSTA